MKIINFQLDILGPGLVKQQQQEITTEAVDGGQLVKTKVITIRPISMLPNVIELSYYSNSMLPHYVMESAVGKRISRSHKHVSFSHPYYIFSYSYVRRIAITENFPR